MIAFKTPAGPMVYDWKKAKWSGPLKDVWNVRFNREHYPAHPDALQALINDVLESEPSARLTADDHPNSFEEGRVY